MLSSGCKTESDPGYSRLADVASAPRPSSTDGEIRHREPTLSSRLVAASSTIPTTFGKYRALRVIAPTASGAMLEAEHAWTGRRVALKWLRGGEPDANARFVRTTRVAGRVAHENVVSVLDAFIAAEVPEVMFEGAAPPLSRR